MDVLWFKDNEAGTATIYENNITLNTVASRHVENAYGVLIGFSSEEKHLIIKPLDKGDVDLDLYKGLDIHRISINPSYGRISGKKIIDNLTKHFSIDFSAPGLRKYVCKWNYDENCLLVYLDKEVNK